MAVLAVFASSVVSAWVAWWITRRVRNEWWPIAAFALQLGLHVAWIGILVEQCRLPDGLVLVLAGVLGVATIALISAVMRFAR